MVTRSALLALIAFAPFVATAAELEGVHLDEHLVAEGTTLQLNGMALRTRLFFRVYVAGLYLPQKASGAAAALDMAGAKRMRLVMLRDVGADQFSEALIEGLKANATQAELARLQPRIDALLTLMREVGEAKKGKTIDLDFVPARGLVVRVNGAPVGKPIEGVDFYAALLRIWLGDHPVSAEMKKGLLGG